MNTSFICEFQQAIRANHPDRRYSSETRQFSASRRGRFLRGIGRHGVASVEHGTLESRPWNADEAGEGVADGRSRWGTALWGERSGTFSDGGSRTGRIFEGILPVVFFRRDGTEAGCVIVPGSFRSLAAGGRTDSESGRCVGGVLVTCRGRSDGHCPAARRSVTTVSPLMPGCEAGGLSCTCGFS